MKLFAALCAVTLLAVAPSTRAQAPASPQTSTIGPAALAEVDRIFAAWKQNANVPGLVYGVVADGELVHVRGMGVQDTATSAPVTPDTLFRIASMSKAFTALAILKLRDEGKVSLDAPAERYVPQMASWRYPTTDSPRITVGNLLTHTAGFVEDNPWGDRQQVMTEPEFTALLSEGVAFSRTPGLAMEYSNTGYAILGRIVSNVSGRPYQDYIGETIMRPIGMASTTYDVLASPQGRRAIGYRWQDNAWVREPDMKDGVFGAMGGVETSANDYARWVAYLLAAWPARDGPEQGPLKRATIREIVTGDNFARAQTRPQANGRPCARANAYAMGWNATDDCALGLVLTHSGGYPGYGSYVMLLPNKGVGVFGFASRTYTAPAPPVLQAALALHEAGAVPDRTLAVSPGLATAYESAKAVWRAGEITAAPLANNVLLDRDAARWRALIAEVKAKVGACAASEAVVPRSAMEGTFTWTCERGRVTGRVQRAPTVALGLQALEFAGADR